MRPENFAHVRWHSGSGCVSDHHGGILAAMVFLNRQRLSVPSRHKRSRILPVFLLAGAGAGLCLLHSYHSFIVNDSLDIPAVRMTRSADTAIRNIRAFEELREEAADDATIIENGSTVPYVVFILGESTNRDRLHLYGYPLENTPNLDELNEKGNWRYTGI